MDRTSIDAKYRWDLSHIYKSEEDWQKDLDRLKSLLPKVSEYRNKLKNPDVLLEFYEFSKEQDILMDKVLIYVYLNHLLDIDNDKYNRMLAEVENLATDFSIASAFVLPELNSYDVEYLENLLKDERFKLHYMGIKDIIKNKPHILSEELEEAISKVGNFTGSFSEVFDAFDCVDVKFPDAIDSTGKAHKVTNSNYGLLLKSRDRELRKSAFESVHGQYKANSTVLANNYIGSVKKDCFYADVYKYKSVLDSNLEGRDLSEAMFNTLLKVVRDNTHLLDKWASLRKDFFKFDKLYPYDLHLPISSLDKTFSYEEACDIVSKALACLGEDYAKAVNEAITNRWIDVYPTDNKDTGGCNVSLYGVHSYILLNHEGTFNDVSALAHELGHAMHSYFTENMQPYEYSDVGIFLAEIASTTNEVLLKKYMYNTSSDKQEKLYILQEFITLITASLFTQTMFTEFEHFAHKAIENKQPLTKEILLDKYDELQKSYGGSVVEDMEMRKYRCLSIPHFYRPYYVYTYATGITCAFNFAKSCLEGDEGVKNYRNFLSSGSSDYPLELLKKSGIDLESESAYKAVLDELTWALNEVEKLIKE